MFRRDAETKSPRRPLPNHLRATVENMFTDHASPGFHGLWPRRRSRTRSPCRARSRCYSGGSSWTNTWRGSSRRCRRSCGDRRSRWRWSNRWNWSRRRGRCWRRRSCGHLKSIYLVISSEVDPTAGNHTGIPLACAGHYFVRPAAVEDDGACVTIIAVQLTIALHVGYPNSHIVSPVSRRHPGGASPALTDVPGESDGRWTCHVNYIRPKFAALPGMKSKVCSFNGLVSSRRRTSKRGIGYVHRSYRRTDTSQVVSIQQIGIAIFAQSEHQL